MPFLKTKKQRERGERIFAILKRPISKPIKIMATDLSHVSTSGGPPPEAYSLPEIENARPKLKGYSGFILCKLILPANVTIVQWHGAKGGSWFPLGPFFLIEKQ